MSKSSSGNENQPFDDVERRLIELFNRGDVEIPTAIDQRIKTRAWAQAQQLRKSRPLVEEVYLAMAADSGGRVARELASQSGKTHLHVYESRNNKSMCLVLIEVMPEHQSSFEGITIALMIGEREALRATLHGGTTEIEIPCAQLQGPGEWRLRELATE